VLLFPADYKEKPASELLSELPRSMGSTEFAKQLLGEVWGIPPSMDLAGAARLNSALVELANKKLIHSAADVSDGGLPVALARCTFANNIGCEIQTSDPYGDITFAYEFIEEAAVVITCAGENVANVLRVAGDQGLGGILIGWTTENTFVISAGDTQYISSSVKELRVAYSSALEAQIAGEVVTA
jgi:phosphoribosylformylglycinamidine synthase